MTWNSLPNLAHDQLVTETNMDQIRENVEHIGAMKFGSLPMSSILQGALLVGGGFTARKTAIQTPTSGVTTKLTWEAEDYDLENAFDLATERYTAPSSGRYLFTYRITTDSDSSIAFTSIYVNGAEAYRGGNLAGAILLNLSYPSYVELFVHQPVASNVNVGTWWSGIKVGLV